MRPITGLSTETLLEYHVDVVLRLVVALMAWASRKRSDANLDKLDVFTRQLLLGSEPPRISAKCLGTDA